MDWSIWRLVVAFGTWRVLLRPLLCKECSNVVFCVIALSRLCPVPSFALPENSEGWLVAFRSCCELLPTG